MEKVAFWNEVKWELCCLKNYRLANDAVLSTWTWATDATDYLKVNAIFDALVDQVVIAVI